MNERLGYYSAIDGGTALWPVYINTLNTMGFCAY